MLAEGPDPDVMAGLHLHPGDLVPAEQAPLLGDPADGAVDRVPLAVQLGARHLPPRRGAAGGLGW